jgi:Fe-S cluster biogenesis protein NfuA
MENIEKDIEKIKKIIDEIGQKYRTAGGNIQFVDIQDRIVRIQPTGYCYR